MSDYGKLGNVKVCDDRKVYRDKILTELFNSNVIQEKITGMCYRNFIKRDTYIHEDILMETFLNLSLQPANTIIEMYENNPLRLIGLSVRIICWKGLAGLNNGKIQPKHSVAKYIMFASNFINSISDLHENSIAETVEYSESIWEVIDAELSSEDLTFLEDHIFRSKKGRMKKDVKTQYNSIITKIQYLIKNKTIKIS